MMKAITVTPECRANDAETLLVVDDDPELRNLAARCLSRFGYKILQAGDPVQALRLATATPAIDLLLTDFEMPEANGLELARRFRAVHPKAPVLMVSGSLLEIESRTAGLDRFAFLAKPFSPDELVDKVHLMLSSQRRPEAESPPRLPAQIMNPNGLIL